jgi:hypothetical protein
VRLFWPLLQGLRKGSPAKIYECKIGLKLRRDCAIIPVFCFQFLY